MALCGSLSLSASLRSRIIGIHCFCTQSYQSMALEAVSKTSQRLLNECQSRRLQTTKSSAAHSNLPFNMTSKETSRNLESSWTITSVFDNNTGYTFTPTTPPDAEEYGALIESPGILQPNSTGQNAGEWRAH